MKLPKCTKTVSGNHIWDKDVFIGTGKYGVRKEDVSMCLGQHDYQERTYEIGDYYPRCSACGIINDELTTKGDK